MSAAEIDVADAVVTEINAAASLGLTASREYLLDPNAMKTATSTQCKVMLVTFEEERDSRATSKETIEIGVVVYQKITSSDTSTSDGLIEKLRLIRKLFLGKTLSGYRVRRVASDPLYEPDLLRDQRVFCGFVSIFADAIVEN